MKQACKSRRQPPLSCAAHHTVVQLLLAEVLLEPPAVDALLPMVLPVATAVATAVPQSKSSALC
jgi:hypothetical protein